MYILIPGRLPLLGAAGQVDSQQDRASPGDGSPLPHMHRICARGLARPRRTEDRAADGRGGHSEQGGGGQKAGRDCISLMRQGIDTSRAINCNRHKRANTRNLFPCTGPELDKANTHCDGM